MPPDKMSSPWKLASRKLSDVSIKRNVDFPCFQRPDSDDFFIGALSIGQSCNFIRYFYKIALEMIQKSPQILLHGAHKPLVYYPGLHRATKEQCTPTSICQASTLRYHRFPIRDLNLAPPAQKISEQVSHSRGRVKAMARPC